MKSNAIPSKFNQEKKIEVFQKQHESDNPWWVAEDVCNILDLYLLTIHSNKPKVKKFKRWITGKVIPTIRETEKSIQVSTCGGNADKCIHKQLAKN